LHPQRTWLRQQRKQSIIIGKKRHARKSERADTYQLWLQAAGAEQLVEIVGRKDGVGDPALVVVARELVGDEHPLVVGEDERRDDVAVLPEALDLDLGKGLVHVERLGNVADLEEQNEALAVVREAANVHAAVPVGADLLLGELGALDEQLEVGGGAVLEDGGGAGRRVRDDEPDAGAEHELAGDAARLPLRRQVRLDVLEGVVAGKRVHLLLRLQTRVVLVGGVGARVDHAPDALAKRHDVYLKPLVPQSAELRVGGHGRRGEVPIVKRKIR